MKSFTPVRLQMLGGLALERPSGPIEGPAAQRHRLALLAVLVASHPHPVPRERLLTLLWPERDDAHARNLLNQAVHALRKALGHRRIRSLNDELKLEVDPAFDCDLLRFREDLEGGRLERALERCAGPFLDGFFLPGSKPFEEWTAEERDAFDQACRAALEERAMASGDAAEAVKWWRRLATMDPDCDRVTMALMEALEAAGDRAAALRLARKHETRLRVEFDAAPNPEVVALAERMRNHPRSPADSGTRPAGGEPGAVD